MKKKEDTKEREPQGSMDAAWKLVVEEHLRRGGKLDKLEKLGGMLAAIRGNNQEINTKPWE